MTDANIPVDMVGVEIDPTVETEAFPEGITQDEEFSETPEGN